MSYRPDPADDPYDAYAVIATWTLHEAGHYVTALPKAAQERFEWQAAAADPGSAGSKAADVRRDCHAAGAWR
jgi:hypothetical protein